MDSTPPTAGLLLTLNPALFSKHLTLAARALQSYVGESGKAIWSITNNSTFRSLPPFHPSRLPLIYHVEKALNQVLSLGWCLTAVWARPKEGVPAGFLLDRLEQPGNAAEAQSLGDTGIFPGLPSSNHRVKEQANISLRCHPSSHKCGQEGPEGGDHREGYALFSSLASLVSFSLRAHGSLRCPQGSWAHVYLGL